MKFKNNILLAICIQSSSLLCAQKYGDTLPLPQSLTNVAYYIQTPQQSGNTCGAHSAVNIYGVNALLKKNEQITKNSLAKITTLQRGWITSKHNNMNTEDEDIIAFLKKLSIPSDMVHFIRYNKDKQALEAIPWIKKSGNEVVPCMSDIETIIQYLKSGLMPAAYFIANTEGHWVAIIALNKGKKIDLIYLNSSNSPVVEGCNTYLVLNALASKLA